MDKYIIVDQFLDGEKANETHATTSKWAIQLGIDGKVYDNLVDAIADQRRLSTRRQQYFIYRLGANKPMGIE